MSLWLEPAKMNVDLPTGIRMAYVEAGTPGAAAVILLHGYAASSRSWFPTLQAMEESDVDLHVFALDLRGHGDSSMPSGPRDAAEPEACFGPAQLAADVIAFMNLLEIASAHVAGHCYGGLVAQELALTRPDRVSSMVLIGSAACGAGNAAVNQLLLPVVEGRWKEALLRRRSPRWPDDAHRLTRRDPDLAGRRAGFDWPQDAYHLTPRDADPDAATWIAREWASEAGASPRLTESIVADAVTTRLGSWVGVLRNIARINNRERLKHLIVPALVLWATQDRFFVEADQAELRAALDLAVRAGRTRYVFKQYGRTPQPASARESDLGHHLQRCAPQTIAGDITAWVMAGRPTRDLPSADPADPRKLVVEKDSALLIENSPAGWRR